MVCACFFYSLQVSGTLSVCTCMCVLVAMCTLYRLWPVLGLLNGLSNWIPEAKGQEVLRRDDVGSLVNEFFKCPENEQLCEKVGRKGKKKII